MCCRLLLRVADGLLHSGDGLLQWLGDTRERLRVLFLQFRGTPLEDALGHIGKLLLQQLLVLLALLPYHLQFPGLRFHLGVQRHQFIVLSLGVCLQMLHPAVGCIEHLLPRCQFNIFLTRGDVEGIHPLVHHHIEHNCPYGYT